MTRHARILTLAALALAAPACIGDEPAPALPELSDEMMAAMQRDLGESEAHILRRLEVERTAAELAPALRARLGAPFAGAWVSDDGSQLVVGVTDAARAADVRAVGGEPRLVRFALAELEAVADALDAAPVEPAIHGWHVDVRANRVVVTAADPAAPAVAALRARLGAAADRVTVIAGPRPRPLADMRGGDEFILNRNTLCSVGFAVERGFVTAGHCGRVGSRTAASNWVDNGTVRGSVFPGNDHAWVELDAGWTSLPWVNDHRGGAVPVAGSQVAAVGSSVCRSGRTTGWRCGRIEAHDVTINYADGPVYGATRTSACAEGGDSGGAFISGNQAQGVTSGGSGNCASGGVTFYQPLNPILAAYGLRLKTTGGEGGGKELVSRWNGRCIDVPGASFVDGAPLQMWDCNGTGAQRWTFVDGTVRAGGKCMDVAWASTEPGTTVQLASCNGNRAQQFVLTPAGDLVSVLADKCVDIAGWNGNNGARLITWWCTGNANQKWTAR